MKGLEEKAMRAEELELELQSLRWSSSQQAAAHVEAIQAVETKLHEQQVLQQERDLANKVKKKNLFKKKFF